MYLSVCVTSDQTVGSRDEICRQVLNAKSRSSSVMGQNALNVTKWWPIKILKVQYVLKGLLFLKNNKTERNLVKNCIVLIFVVNFVHTYSNKMASNQRIVMYSQWTKLLNTSIFLFN